MFSRNRQPERIKTSIEIDGQEIPVKIYFERRKDVRFSFTRTGGFLRMPVQISERESAVQQKKFEAWMKNVAKEKPQLIERLRGRVYEDGSTLTVGKKTYTIRMSEKENATYHTAKIKDDTIHLILCKNGDKGHYLQKSIRQLISRCVGNDRLPDIIERVNYWNHTHFKSPVKAVRFKLNQSNWGSCSTKGNINFSTRLLFAPDDVIDYVIVHELAHTIEQNHSPAFWKIVHDIMPDYKNKEAWLKENGEACNF